MTSVCEDGLEMVNGPRQERYGDSTSTCLRIGEAWAAQLTAADWQPGDPIPAPLVAHLMIAMKSIRELAGSHHRDNNVDICGYAEIAERASTGEEPSKTPINDEALHQVGLIARELIHQQINTKRWWSPGLDDIDQARAQAADIVLGGDDAIEGFWIHATDKAAAADKDHAWPNEAEKDENTFFTRFPGTKIAVERKPAHGGYPGSDLQGPDLADHPLAQPLRTASEREEFWQDIGRVDCTCREGDACSSCPRVWS